MPEKVKGPSMLSGAKETTSGGTGEFGVAACDVGADWGVGEGEGVTVPPPWPPPVCCESFVPGASLLRCGGSTGRLELGESTGPGSGGLGGAVGTESPA
jgi:hypothetical protein